ncbi:hypothetical protein EMIT0P44_130039 [Pseudomonas sp. IT-P44]
MAMNTRNIGKQYFALNVTLHKGETFYMHIYLSILQINRKQDSPLFSSLINAPPS